MRGERSLHGHAPTGSNALVTTHPAQPDEGPPASAGKPRLADRLAALAERPVGAVVLVLLALLEATVFPGPTEAMLIALTLGRRDRVLWFVALAISASVTGGIAGYFLGATLFDDLVRPLFESYGMMRYVDAVGLAYADNMLLALGTSGYTPIPYMLYTAIAGAAQLPLSTFVVGSLVGRTLKYLPIALLTYAVGPRVNIVLRRYGALVAVILVLLLVLYFVG